MALCWALARFWLRDRFNDAITGAIRNDDGNSIELIGTGGQLASETFEASDLLLVLVSVACWFLFQARRRAVAKAAEAQDALTRTQREREQLRGELDILSERMSKAASAQAALTLHVAERDQALA